MDLEFHALNIPHHDCHLRSLRRLGQQRRLAEIIVRLGRRLSRVLAVWLVIVGARVEKLGLLCLLLLLWVLLLLLLAQRAEEALLLRTRCRGRGKRRRARGSLGTHARGTAVALETGGFCAGWGLESGEGRPGERVGRLGC